MRIAVTGAAGLLGRHLRAFLLTVPDVTVVPVGRAEFTPERLPEVLAGVDAVVHLAGMNRGDDDQILRVNVELAGVLTGALEALGAAPQVVFSSSTHVERDSAYGRSKRDAAAVFAAWAERSGAAFTNVVLPGVFGEGGVPFYNSVVSTFCAQLSRGEVPVVQSDAAVEQVHAQVVAREFLRLIREGVRGDVRVQGTHLTVSELLARLRAVQEGYAVGIVPVMPDDFSRDLFNTYRSYLFPQVFPRALTVHADDRGALFEFVKSGHGGQAFLSTTRPGITRGNHFHTRKYERFIVVGGEAVIRLRHVLEDVVHEFPVSGAQPSYVDIPTLYTHNITNVGSSELTTLFWTNEFFDPNNADTTPCVVELPVGGVA